MKKLKILPTMLMLVLCVGVLAIGVFAITPTKNTISGTITINASNTPVTIKVYENDASGKLLASAEVRSGKILEVGSLNFNMQNANTIDQVAPIKLAVVFSTTFSEKLVIDTETIESLNGTTIGSKTVKDIVSVTKLHSYSQTEEGLACFTNGADYTITCTFRLVDFVSEEVTINFGLNFDIYKASEYTGDGINGVDYLYFGSFPQTEAESTTGLTDTGRTFAAYDDATGGKTQRAIYADAQGNEYVRVDNIWKNVWNEDSGCYYFEVTTETKYYKFEPLKWRILTEEDGTALLICENIVEQVAFQNEGYKDSAKTYYSEEARYYVKGEDGKPMLNEDTEAADDYIYANNYAYSDLRAYLTDTFYNGAFNSLQKQLIQLTEVNNKTGAQEKIDYAIETNEYAEATKNTSDYVFALSHDDYVNEEYKFKPMLSSGANVNDDETGYWFDIARMIKNTGYSSATGAYTSETYSTFEELTSDWCCGETTLEEFMSCYSGEYAETTAEDEQEFLEHANASGWWWSRSSNRNYSYDARYVEISGSAGDYYSVSRTDVGCVPALRIGL